MVRGFEPLLRHPQIAPLTSTFPERYDPGGSSLPPGS
jgi:hypothetical protein